ncbi:MAG: hypothetical protein GY928_28955 [Colwellia sp.]|nr:hypothetical protein [Colwellia sp.]
MWRRGTVLSLIAWAASTNKFIPKRVAECRMDVIGFQFTIADKIVDDQADYALALKGNGDH